jgi:hypothetical protein
LSRDDIRYDITPPPPQSPAQTYEDKRLTIQRSLTHQTSVEHVEAQRKATIDQFGYHGTAEDWSYLVSEWHDFLAKISEGDEIWEYDTVETHLGFSAGEQGVAAVRQGQVIAWYVTAVVG